MIHYQLRCSKTHEFDGWFSSGDSFDKQAKMGLVECPECGDTKVERALMAPAVPKKRSSMTPPPPAPTPEAAPAPSVPAMGAGGRMPAQMVAMLQRLRAEVEKNCDYVGPDLAEEARRIHRGESEERGIYGEASAEEAESLAEEGIELQSIPWVSRADG